MATQFVPGTFGQNGNVGVPRKFGFAGRTCMAKAYKET
jgi:hypothetical protein